MKPTKFLLVLAILLAPGLVAAQGYYAGPGPVPGGFHNRAGRLAWGFSLGLGYMNENGQSITCSGCDAQPVTGEADFHIGGMIGPRMAILFELQGNAQQIALDPNTDVTLTQTLVMGAVQYWLTPQLWLKGGIGFAHLDFNDNLAGVSYSAPSTGLGLMGGIGFELMSARNFALDLQGRLTEGSYSGMNSTLNDHITSGTIGVGLNWY
jgi:hypothetical protein